MSDINTNKYPVALNANETEQPFKSGNWGEHADGTLEATNIKIADEEGSQGDALILGDDGKVRLSKIPSDPNTFESRTTTNQELPPSAGRVVFSNNDIVSSTEMHYSYIINGSDAKAQMNYFIKSGVELFIQLKDNQNIFYSCIVSSVTDNDTYMTVSISTKDSNGMPFQNNSNVLTTVIETPSQTNVTNYYSENKDTAFLSEESDNDTIIGSKNTWFDINMQSMPIDGGISEDLILYKNTVQNKSGGQKKYSILWNASIDISSGEDIVSMRMFKSDNSIVKGLSQFYIEHGKPVNGIISTSVTLENNQSVLFKVKTKDNPNTIKIISQNISMEEI